MILAERTEVLTARSGLGLGRERDAVTVRADRPVHDPAARRVLGPGRRDELDAVVAVLARDVALVDVLHRVLGELGLCERRRGEPGDGRAQSDGRALAQRAAARDAASLLIFHDSPLGCPAGMAVHARSGEWLEYSRLRTSSAFSGSRARC